MDTFMLAAIEEAEKGLSEGGIPIGSVLVHDGRISGDLPNFVQAGIPNGCLQEENLKEL
ncbi:MAG TPA: hypothetical protein VFQ99_01230 [Gallionella sp.]|nr:hypothetical protein [Gallionella sp.]